MQEAKATVETITEHPDIPKMYSTTDFNLVAYLTALRDGNGTPQVRVVSILPVSDNRFRFILGGQNGEPINAELRAMELEYTAHKGNVEPRVYDAQRTRLHSMLDQYVRGDSDKLRIHSLVERSMKTDDQRRQLQACLDKFLLDQRRTQAKDGGGKRSEHEKRNKR